MIDGRKIIQGDCLEKLKELSDESVDCCVTSPPYYGLRDYGVSGQIGLEETPEEYIKRLTDVFHEVKRVLKKDGTLWVNIGDSYNGAKKGNTEIYKHSSVVTDSFNKKLWAGAKQKDLIGIPWMLAFALRQDGWYLRQDIIWHKPNPMPESVKDRCTKSHEYLFLLSKSPQYYFDYEAIQEEAIYKDDRRNGQSRIVYDGKRANGEDDKAQQSFVVVNEKRNKRDVWAYDNSKYDNAEQESSVRQGMNKERGNKIIALRKNLPPQEDFVMFMRRRTSVDQLSNSISVKRSTIEHWFRTDASGFSYPSVEDWLEVRDILDDWSDEFADMNERLTNVTYETDDIGKNNNGKRTKRDVWTVVPSHVRDAHFATYPEELVEPCILAGTREGGVVLDPFFGSGTTGRVAERLGRKWIGIELNPEYVEIAKKRTNDIQTQLLF